MRKIAATNKQIIWLNDDKEDFLDLNIIDTSKFFTKAKGGISHRCWAVVANLFVYLFPFSSLGVYF